MIDFTTLFAKMCAQDVQLFGQSINRYSDSQIVEAIQMLEQCQSKLIDKFIKDGLNEMKPNSKTDTNQK